MTTKPDTYRITMFADGDELLRRDAPFLRYPGSTPNLRPSTGQVEHVTVLEPDPEGVVLGGVQQVHVRVAPRYGFRAAR
ncbi:hypothetical protein [Yinghuangia aomiensis]